MNFPVGEVIARGVAPFDLVTRVEELQSQEFNGYIVLAVKGDLIEEGILFFKEGKVLACIVECLAAGKTLKGSSALEYFGNQVKGNGFFQVVSLTKSQVDLVFAFDEQLLLQPKIDLKDLPRFIPSAFLPRFSRPKEEKSVLEYHGLGGIK